MCKARELEKLRKSPVAFLKKSSAKYFCSGGFGVFNGGGFRKYVFCGIFLNKATVFNATPPARGVEAAAEHC
jgi:hypothetical protein